MRAFLLPAAALALAALAGCAASPPGESRIERLTTEDALARVDARRVRGQVESVEVQPKSPAAPAYAILPSNPQRVGAAPDASGGRRVWRVADF